MADDDTERIYKEMASSKQVSCYTFNFFLLRNYFQAIDFSVTSFVGFRKINFRFAASH